ncbi:hypothetical protein BH23PLA1_BH23PLA1_26900 [soil metagenome]
MTKETPWVALFALAFPAVFLGFALLAGEWGGVVGVFLVGGLPCGALIFVLISHQEVVEELNEAKRNIDELRKPQAKQVVEQPKPEPAPKLVEPVPQPKPEPKAEVTPEVTFVEEPAAKKEAPPKTEPASPAAEAPDFLKPTGREPNGAVPK